MISQKNRTNCRKQNPYFIMNNIHYHSFVKKNGLAIVSKNGLHEKSIKTLKAIDVKK